MLFLGIVLIVERSSIRVRKTNNKLPDPKKISQDQRQTTITTRISHEQCKDQR